MKLLNKSLLYFSVTFFVVIGLWSVIFYFNMLNEIKESVDEGLENYKRQIIFQSQYDTTVFRKKSFETGFFSVCEVQREKAVFAKDRYIDTLMYMQDADDEVPELEPVRMLTTFFENDGRFYELQIINSMVEEDDLVAELLQDVLWLYFILIVVVVLLNNVVLQQLWKPFYTLLNQLKNYRLGKSASFPKVKTQTREFVDLQNAIAVLLHQNVSTYEQQNQFIGNASHELQTPLAVIVNKLELLIEKGDLQSQQAESIAEVLYITERLIRLNKSLLLLTKIENRQLLTNEEVALHNVVAQTVLDLEEIAAYKQVQIEIVKQEEVKIFMDISLAGLVVSNLLRNAVFHNVVGGVVQVELANNVLKVSNTGTVFSLDKQKIFQRFYKQETHAKGTGLGLAIVKAVCNLYGFAVSYTFQENKHCFVVKLS